MTHEATATLVAGFRDTAGDESGQLAIEGDPGLYDDDLIHLLLYGYPVDNLAVNVGSIWLGSTKVIDVPGGYISMNGSDFAAFPRVVTGGDPQPKVEFAYDLEGNLIGGEGGGPGSLSITSDSRGVKANMPVHAAISYQPYQTTAVRLRYQPLLESHPSLGVRVTYGVIAAFKKPGTMLIYQIEPTTLLENGNDDLVEVYRIVSEGVTTPDGEFEKPPNYPTDGKFPGLDVEIDPTVSIRTKRVHEIGYVNMNGAASVVRYIVRPATPYTFDDLYVIPTTCETTNLPEGTYSKELILKALDFIKSRGLGCKGV